MNQSITMTKDFSRDLIIQYDGCFFVRVSIYYCAAVNYYIRLQSSERLCDSCCVGLNSTTGCTREGRNHAANYSGVLHLSSSSFRLLCIHRSIHKRSCHHVSSVTLVRCF
ncbi:unnamed protein product [Musa acuminata subsp. malaccensis]|uniref:(wild Malaysian banana) hypothetical protein n=1 Tax=Musa acuminata subsp. malaccensis TaxID=214687 RepID=A0A804KDF8_MUSAM|nr:unnamed protein product [Musa acuminata subsp. malaccensis]